MPGRSTLVLACLLALCLPWSVSAQESGPVPSNPGATPAGEGPILPAPQPLDGAAIGPDGQPPICPFPAGEPAPPAGPALDNLGLPLSVRQSANQGLSSIGVGAGPGLNMLSPVVGNLPFLTGFRGSWYPTQPVTNQSAFLGYARTDFTGLAPIWQNPNNEWSLTANVHDEIFHTDAILPDTKQPFPNDLWNIHFGTGYRHLFENGWIGGGSVSIGSASDKPFASIHEMVVGANVFTRVPQGEHNAWLFSLNYSTNSQVLNGIPIPGVAYFYAPSPWFQAMVGLPFASVTVRPWDDVTLQFSYALLTNIHARAVYRVLPRLTAFGGFDWSYESYFLAERTDNRDRLFYNYKDIKAGLQYRLTHSAQVEMSGGYLFDRFYFEGQSFGSQHSNRIDVGDGPYMSLHLQLFY